MVEFIGWFDPRSLDDKAAREGVTDRGLEVTFVVNPDGSYYLFTITVLDKLSDGKMSRVKTLDTNAVLQSVYANKKIAL